MATTKPVQKSRFDLPFSDADRMAPESDIVPDKSSLPSALLLRNALWFCRLRWIVVVILMGFGFASFVLPHTFDRFGIQSARVWPLTTGFILVCANLCHMAHCAVITRTRKFAAAKANLWIQIVIDLLVLTAVIHFAGSMETFASFLYLVHIVLACIFFSRPESFVVTVISCGLYAVCVHAESAGIIQSTSLFVEKTGLPGIEGSETSLLVNVISAQAIWLVVWYLASELSGMVRHRTHELSQTNERLQAAQVERTRHMLRTTHEMKAPFAAIQANTQLLLDGYCGEIPDSAREVMLRISTRCQRLTREIHEMLQLANLRSMSSNSLEWTVLEIDQTLEWCLGQIQTLADTHNVEIKKSIGPGRTVGIEDHVKMLLANVLSNAVLYSHDGGCVKVESRSSEDGGPLVTVEDNGIGIPADKLPKIFGEYYHTDEAIQHNKGSTGLGLAIVQHVAQTHGVRIQVESEPGSGTTFVMEFRPAAGDTQTE